MPNYVSPGVYVIEKDLSDYTPSINSSVVGITGFASKGPINDPTLITSQQQLVKTFGAPSENITGQGIEGALEILEETNVLYFNRSVDANAADASAIVPIGTCPAVGFEASGFGVSADLYLRINAYDHAGNKIVDNKKFAIPSGTVGSNGKQGEALRKVLGGGLQSNDIGVFYDSSTDTSGFLVGSYAGSEAYFEVSAYSDSGYTTGVSAIYPVHPSATDTYGSDPLFDATNTFGSSCKAFGATYLSDGSAADAAVTDASGIFYKVESLYPGAGYNSGTRSDGSLSGNAI